MLAVSSLLPGSLLVGRLAAQTKFQINKTEEQWKTLLTKPQYHILFNEGTERSNSSPFNHEKRDGTFICAACFNPLFKSATKYDSGTGWPSFYRPIEGGITTKRDYKLLFPRTEYHCTRCGGHQGHVFDDGPKPTGLRYCNNGLAMLFVPKSESLPALRS